MKTLTRYTLADVAPGNRLLGDVLSGRYVLPGHARFPRRGADPAAVSAALVDFQRHLGAGETAVAQAQRLADPMTPVVTVGQQPGLLTGPLYTPYKAMTALSLARQLGGVAVFWAGCDDDDRAEIDHCGCWDRQGRLVTIRYPEDAGEPGQLVGDLPADEYGAQVLAQITPLLEGLPHTDVTLALLRDTLAESADLGEWFCRLLARLFGPLGLVVCDPRLPAMRRLGSEVLRRELAEPLRTTALVNAGARALRDGGYEAALTKPEDSVNAFLYDGRRHRITCHAGHFLTREERFTTDELLALLESEPGRLLPNAVLRPVMQEYLFGSAAFVAGPNEVCYWAELPEVFQALGVNMPPVIARAGATLVPRAAADYLRAQDLDPLRLLTEYDEVRLELLSRAQPPAVEQAFTQARAEVERLVAGLVEIVSAYDTTLAGSALATHQRMLNEIERLERKALKAVERQAADITDRLERVTNQLFPTHGLQERALNIMSVLARYGLHWPKEMLELLDGQEGRHLVVEI